MVLDYFQEQVKSFHSHMLRQELLRGGNLANPNNRKPTRRQSESILHQKRQFLAASGGEINTSLVSRAVLWVRAESKAYCREYNQRQRAATQQWRERKKCSLSLSAQERELCKPI
jgi:hypothetical protein